MPRYDYIPREDAHLVGWYNNFAANCAENADELGLSPDEVEAIFQASRRLDQDLLALQEAHAAYRAAVAKKDTTRSETVEFARIYARIFKANPGVTPSLQMRLGIVSSAPSSAVVPVNNLVADGDGNGVIALRWDRNGNSRGTSFLVEYRAYADGEWRTAGVTTKTRFKHTGQVVGRTLAYRITSIRSDEVSIPCPVVLAYVPQESSHSFIAA